MTTEYKLSVSGKVNEKNFTKSFTNISSDVTIAFGTEFASKLLDLTVIAPKAVTISRSDTADISGD